MSGTPVLSKVALAIACALATLNAPLACTAVDIVAADKSVIAGRTMEWAFDMQWTLISQPKGTPIALTAPPGVKLPAKTVATKYSVVGISANIIPGGALLEGQNSAGLGMSGNFLPGFTQYQAVTRRTRTMSRFSPSDPGHSATWRRWPKCVPRCRRSRSGAIRRSRPARRRRRSISCSPTAAAPASSWNT